MPPEIIPYCARLNVLAPRIEDFVGTRNIKLFDLLVVALLERGEPTAIEALADRLVAAGAEAATGDMVYSLKKAWHGMQPVFREPDGRLSLNLPSPELERLLFRLGLRTSRIKPTPLPPEPEPVSDDVPLTKAEVRWAFGQRSLYNLSAIRQAAAVLDACAQPMSIENVESYLSDLTPHRPRLSAADTHYWEKSCLHVDAEGRLWLNRTAPEVRAMRRAIRKLARPSLMREAREQHWQRVSQERKDKLSAERERQQRDAVQLRRAVLRVVPEHGLPVAVALLDVGAHAVETFVGDELARLPAAVKEFDLVAALWVREALHALGTSDQDRFRLVDLQPPRKTRRLNREGRSLTITPQLLITSTTGISRPLGDFAKLATYLATGQIGKLRRRIESDVKALFSFYHYGVLQGCVRLRWGFLNEVLPVDWAVPGDVHLYEMLKECHARGTRVDLVWGSAPGWNDPWSRARSVKVVLLEAYYAVIEGDGQQWSLPRSEIQAIRPTAEAPEGA